MKNIDKKFIKMLADAKQSGMEKEYFKNMSFNDDSDKKMLARLVLSMDADWREELHPRDNEGKFTSGGGNSGSVKKQSSNKKLGSIIHYNGVVRKGIEKEIRNLGYEDISDATSDFLSNKEMSEYRDNFSNQGLLSTLSDETIRAREKVVQMEEKALSRAKKYMSKENAVFEKGKRNSNYKDYPFPGMSEKRSRMENGRFREMKAESDGIGKAIAFARKNGLKNRVRSLSDKKREIDDKYEFEMNKAKTSSALI